MAFLYFVCNSAHALGSLIVLEYAVLLIFARVGVITHNTQISGHTLIVLFVVSVSAAGVGLSLIIPLARSHGKDLFSGFKVL